MSSSIQELEQHIEALKQEQQRTNELREELNTSLIEAEVATRAVDDLLRAKQISLIDLLQENDVDTEIINDHKRILAQKTREYSNKIEAERNTFLPYKKHGLFSKIKALVSVARLNKNYEHLERDIYAAINESGLKGSDTELNFLRTELRPNEDMRNLIRAKPETLLELINARVVALDILKEQNYDFFKGLDDSEYNYNTEANALMQKYSDILIKIDNITEAAFDPAIFKVLEKGIKVLKEIEATAVDENDEQMTIYIKAQCEKIKALTSVKPIDLAAVEELIQELDVFHYQQDADVTRVKKAARAILENAENTDEENEAQYKQVLDALKAVPVEQRAGLWAGENNRVLEALAISEVDVGTRQPSNAAVEFEIERINNILDDISKLKLPVHDEKLDNFIRSRKKSLNEIVENKNAIDLAKLIRKRSSLENILQSLAIEVAAVYQAANALKDAQGNFNEDYTTLINEMRDMPIKTRANVLSGKLNKVHKILAENNIFPNMTKRSKDDISVRYLLERIQLNISGIKNTRLSEDDAIINDYVSVQQKKLDEFHDKDPINLCELYSFELSIEKTINSLYQVAAIKCGLSFINSNDDASLVKAAEIRSLVKAMPLNERFTVLSGKRNQVHDLLVELDFRILVGEMVTNNQDISSELEKAERFLNEIERTRLPGTDTQMDTYLTQKRAYIAGLRAQTHVNLVELLKFNKGIENVHRTLETQVKAVTDAAEELLKKKSRTSIHVQDKYDKILANLASMDIEQRATVLTQPRNTVVEALATKRYTFFGKSLPEDKKTGAIKTIEAAESYRTALDKAGLLKEEDKPKAGWGRKR